MTSRPGVPAQPSSCHDSHDPHDPGRAGSGRWCRMPRPGAAARLAAFGMLALWLAAARVEAQQPSPLDIGLWQFPGASSAPATARSASFALANRWLGDQPFDNPAAGLHSGVSASGLIEHVSRQDLRSVNRQFSEQSAFIDFGGAWVAVPVGSVKLVAYAYQPVLRLEDNTFTRGELGGPTQPAVVLSNGSARELRAGLAVSKAFGPLRVGAAGEWNRRSDVYEYEERSGSPDQGLRHVDFAGDGVGGQAGITWGEDAADRRGFTLGLSARYAPAITVDGVQSFHLLSGDSTGTVASDHDSGVEAGASIGYRLNETFRVMLGAGGRSQRAWPDFGVTGSRALQWGVGGEFHDARDPWTLRFGVGQEHEPDNAEFRSGLVGLGVGWKLDHSSIDVGLLHRSINRGVSPTSYDDRVIASVAADF